MLPVNLLDRTLISDPIRETQGFRMICDLRRPARGGEWRCCRSVRRIERPAKSNNRERRKYCGNAAVNDVTPDSASCFYGGVFPSIILLRDFSVKVAKNLWEMRKKIGLITPSLSSCRPSRHPYPKTPESFQRKRFHELKPRVLEEAPKRVNCIFKRFTKIVRSRGFP